MNSYNKIYLEKIAKEKGFVRDNLEKVMRLSEILQYFNQTEPPQKHSIIKGSFDHVVSKILIPQGHDYNIVEDK